MNRPKRSDYVNGVHPNFNRDMYVRDLNRYCDSLEKENKELKMELFYTKKQKEFIKDVRDKACEMLDDTSIAFDKLMRKTYELLISNGCERCPCRFDCDELQYLKGGRQNLNYLDCYKQLKEWSMRDE